MANPTKRPPSSFIYAPASAEEITLRQLLIGAILEFGAPHAFESGAMTQPIETRGKTPPQTPALTAPMLDYVMLHEEGAGYSLFAALRTVYPPQTPVEPVRFAAQFFTPQGSAFVDVAIPSRYAAADSLRPRSYDEKIGPHARIGLINSAKKTKLEDVLNSFMLNKDITEDFKPLLTIMHEQVVGKDAQALSPAHMKLLAEFLQSYFGDFSHQALAMEHPDTEEIIPETPAEVPQSDHWMQGVARAAEQYRHPS